MSRAFEQFSRSKGENRAEKPGKARSFRQQSSRSCSAWGGQNAKIQSGAELNLLLQCEPTHDSNRQTTRGKDRINQQIRETERREIHHSEHPEEQISSEQQEHESRSGKRDVAQYLLHSAGILYWPENNLGRKTTQTPNSLGQPPLERSVSKLDPDGSIIGLSKVSSVGPSFPLKSLDNPRSFRHGLATQNDFSVFSGQKRALLVSANRGE
jgi:hypothetical protein